MGKGEPKGLVKAGPARMLSPFEAMERRFEEFFRKPFSMIGFPWWSGLERPEEEVTPSVDIYEESGHVVVKAELPGMKKEDIAVKLTDDSITISGEKRKEEKVEKEGYYRLERSHGSFSRSFALPSEILTEGAKATFKEGVLEIRIPKTEAAKKKVKAVSIE